MKTIFITSFNPFISRNILETGILGFIRQQGNIRVVIFVPDYKKDYFIDNFRSEFVIIEGVKGLPISKQDILFRYLVSSLVDTTTRFFHQRDKFSKDGNYIHFSLSRFLAKTMSKSTYFKRFVGWLDSMTIKRNFQKYFEKYSPSLLFSTDIFHNSDIHFLAEAKKQGLLTVGMVRSWDNITNKGLFRVKPDKLIVHNEIIKNEAVKYENFNLENIFVSGIPQMDYYINKPRISRVDFFKRLGFDPLDILIFVGPLGRRFTDTDGQVLDILKQSILKKKLPSNVRFLVRLPPNDDTFFGDFVPNDNFYIYKPGVQFKENIYSDWEVTIDEVLSLADSLYHSDLVVVYASSLILDAAAFDKPIVLISFDGQEKKPVLKSVSRFVEYYEHTKKMLKTGACFVAKDSDEMIYAINMYIDDSSLDRSGRDSLVIEQIGKLDGKSAQRIAGLLSELVL